MKLKLCGYPGCTKLHSNKYYCAEHQILQNKKKKESAFKTATRYADYNTPEWRALKTRILKEHPYCSKCGATDNLQVHHIVPVRQNPDLMFCEGNLMVLCRSCHQVETQREIKERHHE